MIFFFVKREVIQSLPVVDSKVSTLDDEAIACQDTITRNRNLPLNVFFLEKNGQFLFIAYLEEKNDTIRLTRRAFEFDPIKQKAQCRIGNGPLYTVFAKDKQEALQKVVEHLASTTEQKGSYVNAQEYRTAGTVHRIDDTIRRYELESFSLSSEDPACFGEDIDEN